MIPIRTKTIDLHFRCTPEENREISRRAEQEKKSISAYVRDAALNRNIPKLDEKTNGLLRELTANELKIGNNINQAVRLCNSKKLVSREDYEKLVQYLKELMVFRKEITKKLQDSHGG